MHMTHFGGCRTVVDFSSSEIGGFFWNKCSVCVVWIRLAITDCSGPPHEMPMSLTSSCGYVQSGLRNSLQRHFKKVTPGEVRVCMSWRALSCVCVFVFVIGAFAACACSCVFHAQVLHSTSTWHLFQVTFDAPQRIVCMPAFMRFWVFIYQWNLYLFCVSKTLETSHPQRRRMSKVLLHLTHPPLATHRSQSASCTLIQ